MKHLLGVDASKGLPVLLNTQELINAHMLIAGMTGTGKSHQIRRLLRSAIVQGVEVDVFDVHDELGIDHPAAVEIRYSRATGYGYNPLEINPDEHSGGVQRQINDFVALVKSVRRQFGPRQESVLRNLLADLYAASGCFEDNPSTWHKKSITEAQRAHFIATRDYAALREYFPTISDLISYGERKISHLTIGTDNRSHAALTALMRTIGQTNQNRTKRHTAMARGEIAGAESMDRKIAELREQAVDHYREFVMHAETGREMADLLKYDSADTLRSVVESIQMLSQSGVMRANPPPVGNALIRIHKLKALSDEEQQLFVYTQLERIFRRRRDAGEQPDVVHGIVVDEAHKFVRDQTDAIENKIALEGRKFGMGLWFASQSVEHFPDDYLTSCGSILILGLHPKHWTSAIRNLKVSEPTMRAVQPREQIALRTFRRGSATQSDFRLCRVGEQDVQAAFKSLQQSPECVA